MAPLKDILDELAMDDTVEFPPEAGGGAGDGAVVGENGGLPPPGMIDRLDSTGGYGVCVCMHVVWDRRSSRRRPES